MKKSPRYISWLLAAAVGIAMGLSSTSCVRAQTYHGLVGKNLHVRSIAFKGNETLSETQLKGQMALSEISLLDRLQFWKTPNHPFHPITLQKDAVRLRQFYMRNGFLHPQIEYFLQPDTSDRRVGVVFTVQEGPPLIINRINVANPANGQPVGEQLRTEVRDDWQEQIHRIQTRSGERFTTSILLSLQDDIQRWLQNEGYAFARVSSDTTITHAHNVADADSIDINLRVKPGPLAHVSDIQVEGNESISEAVILRTIPLKVGDRFSQRELMSGQEQLFSLNLFRLALADVPPQPEDSTVTIRYRLREARLRSVSARTGYSLRAGMNVQGDWIHRNFLGNARNLIASAEWSTGVLALERQYVVVPTRWRLSLSLRQPYLFTPRLSGVLSPFFERNLQSAYQIQQFGLNTTLLFQIYQFRTVSLRHSYARTTSLSGTGIPLAPENNGTLSPLTSQDQLYSKSIITLSGTFGKLDNYVNPTDGFTVRPILEIAGSLMASDVNYGKIGLETAYYRPLTERIGLRTRLFGGRIWPYGSSANQDDPTVALRFRDIRYYAGGPDDVRGWAANMLGPKSVAEDSSTYIPHGGLAKAMGNLELNFPFPGLGESWGLATFLDFGQVSSGKFPPDPSTFRYGAGGGLQYSTPVGPLRIDVAYKLNPSPNDTRPPVGPREPSIWRRFAFYLSLGHAF